MNPRDLRTATDARALLDAAVRSASVTRSVDVDPGAIGRLPQVLARLGQRGPCRIVADSNTMAAAGQRTLATLRAANIATADPIVLDEVPRVKPRAETARDVAARLRAEAALPIAVGAGVINDMTKYAAEVAGMPYVSVVTAASMDGYAASGASMLDGGFKRTLACAPPIGVIADLDVVADAPARMAAWGYGDLAGKLVAGADWTLADALGEDPIDRAPFALVQDHVKGWLAGYEGIGARRTEALRGLVDGLLIAGFAMQAHGNSRPASGSDHQIAHVWEMEGLRVDGEPAAHGACVGIGTVAMLALYEWFVAQDVPGRAAEREHAPPLDRDAIEAELQASFAEASLVASARTEMEAKLSRAHLRMARLRALQGGWPALRARIEARIVPAAMLQRWLAACGAASQPRDVGVPLCKLAKDYRRARLIRRRYTLLDCLEDLAWLDAAIDAVFAHDGFWGRGAPTSPA
jgi:glycerol-1-phosphate dehydrogenase [NAD(P)+]